MDNRQSEFTLPNGMTAVLLTDEHAKLQEKNYKSFEGGTIQIGSEKWFHNIHYPKFAPIIYNFDYRKSDIAVVTHPKCGTHWMLETVWNLVHNHRLDNPKSQESFEMRTVDLEGIGFLSEMGESLKLYFEPTAEGNSEDDSTNYGNNHFLKKMEVINEEMPNSRILKLHHVFELLPDGFLDRNKTIYVARNPFDVCNSMYHFSRLITLGGFTGTLDEFIDDFIAGRCYYGPIFSHMKQAWDLRDHPNLLFIFYEDMISDVEKEMRKIVQFLGLNRSDEEIKNVSQFVNFESLKKRFKGNPPTSYNLQFFDKKLLEESGGFFRKGKVNDWKNYFTEEQYKKFSAFCKEKLKAFGEEFKYNKTLNLC